MRIAGWFLVLACLAGCATVSYVEPTAGPTARVRFAVDTKWVTVVRGYETQSCAGEKEWMRLRVGPLVNSDPRTLGMPLWEHHKNAAKEIRVPSNRPLIALFHGAEMDKSTIYECGVPIIYGIEAGNDYELSFKWDRKACNVDLFEIVQVAPGSHERKLLRNFDNRVTYDNEECMKAFLKVRLY